MGNFNEECPEAFRKFVQTRALLDQERESILKECAAMGLENGTLMAQFCNEAMTASESVYAAEKFMRKHCRSGVWAQLFCGFFQYGVREAFTRGTQDAMDKFSDRSAV